MVKNTLNLFNKFNESYGCAYMIKKKTISDRVVNVLLVSIYINLIPIILASQVVPGLRGRGIYTVIVASTFVIQNILILYVVSRGSFKISKQSIIAGISLVVILTITLFIQSFSSSIYFDKNDYINVPVRFIAFCSFLCILSRISIPKSSLLKFFKGIIVLGVIASIFNLFINYDQLLNVFNVRNAYAYNFQSFYLNRNTYAQLLFFSIIANTVLFMEKKTKVGLVFYILFGFNLISTFSRGSLLAVAVFFLIYFIITNRKAIMKKVTVVAGGVVTLALIWTSSRLQEFVIQTLIRSDVGTTKRTGIWDVAFQLLDETSWLFGIGEFSAVNYLNQFGYSNSQFHSFYVETLVTGGLSLLIFFIGVLWFIAKKIKLIMKNDKNIGVVYFAGFISMIIYAFFESISFFTMGYVGTLYSTFFISIPLMYSNSFVIDGN